MNYLSLIKKIIPGCLISLGFVGLDMIWIRALPTLDLSFDHSSTSFLIFFFVRSSLFFIWLVALVIRFFNYKHINFHLFPWALIIPNLFVLVLGIYGFCYEPFHLTVSYFDMPVPGLKRPMRIIQLSDIHVERTTKRERDLPPLVASLNPDMIVMTGDYLNESYLGDPQAISDLRDLLRQLHAPFGIFAVNGNVETPWDMMDWFNGLDIHVLNDQVWKIPDAGEHFTIVGLSIFPGRNNDQALTHLMDQVKPHDFSLLLYHKPDLAYTARDLGVNLYLTGHTHGGQVRLPFYGALWTNSKYGKQFEMGLYNLDTTTLFVSRGLGLTGGDAPRIRLLCPPEIVVIDLVPKEINQNP
jgi:hypothetical protein